MLFVVDLFHLCCEVLGIAMAEFLYGVDTGCLKKFGKLRTDAVDAEQVGVVGPAQNQFWADAGFFGEFFASFRGGCRLQQVVGSFDAGVFKCACIGFANTLDFDNFISNSCKFRFVLV